MQSVMNVNQSPTMPSEWAMLKEMAAILTSSGMLPPAIKRPEQALAVILMGRELKMPPMQAFSHINIIQGKPTLSAESMLALIFSAYPKTVLNYIQNDDEACIIEVKRPGYQEFQRFSFTIADAETAGLTKKGGNWNNYRRAMLRSRAISEMARSLFPDALHGCSYTPEEVEDEVKMATPVKAVIDSPKQPEEPPAEAPPAATKPEQKKGFDPQNSRHLDYLKSLLKGAKAEDCFEHMRRLMEGRTFTDFDRLLDLAKGRLTNGQEALVK